MKERIRQEIESGNMKAEMLCRKYGGIEKMSDEEIAKVARQLKLKEKSVQQTLIEQYVQLKREQKDAQKEGLFDLLTEINQKLMEVEKAGKAFDYYDNRGRLCSIFD